jgi:hypothetical protein
MPDWLAQGRESDVIAGADPADWATPPVPVGDYQAVLTAGLQRVRVGVPRAYFWGRLDSDVAAAVVARGLIHSTEALAYHAAWLRERPDDYRADVRERVSQRRDTTGTALAEAQSPLARFGADVNALLETVDVLVAPTPPTPAWPFGATDVTLNGVLARSVAHAELNRVSWPRTKLLAGKDRLRASNRRGPDKSSATLRNTACGVTPSPAPRPWRGPGRRAGASPNTNGPQRRTHHHTDLRRTP